MNKSDLIEALAKKQSQLTAKKVDQAVDCIIEQMCLAMVANHRVEIRDFGAFSLHYHPARRGRNPKTGETLLLSPSYMVHFKPGKALRERVDQSRHTCQVAKDG